MALSLEEIQSKYSTLPAARPGAKTKKEGFGVQNFVSGAIDKNIRLKKLQANALIGDIPFVKNILPQGVRDLKPEGIGENFTFAAPRLARDLFIGGKIFKAAPVAGGLVRQAASNFGKGALLGAITAGSNNPVEIAKKAGQMGAFTTVLPGAFKIAARGVPAVVNQVGKRVPAPVSKWVYDMSIKLGKATGVLSKHMPGIQGSVEKRTVTIAEQDLFSEMYLKAFETRFPDKVLQQAIPFLREGTAVPAALGLPPEIVQYVDNVRVGGQPFTRPVADALRVVDAFYKKGYKKLVEYNKIINPKANDVAFTDDYVNRLWSGFSTKTQTEKNAILKWFTTQNPNNLKRTIKTLEEGAIKFGLKVETTNILDLMRVYNKNLIRTRANAQFVNELKTFAKTHQKLTNTALVIPYDKRKAAGMFRSDHPVLIKAFGKGKESVLIHPDLQPTIESLFGKLETSFGWEQLDKLNQIYKYSNLTMSGFHPIVLTETSMLNDTLKAADFNPAKIMKTLEKGGTYILANPREALKAIRAGVNVGPPIDAVENAFEKMLFGLEEGLANAPSGRTAVSKGLVGGISGYRKLVRAQSRFLWGYLNPSFKVQGYNILRERVRQNPKFAQYSAEQVDKAVAEWVNNSWGGQNWANLGASPQWKQGASRLLLSPDWTVSTNKQLFNAFGVGEVPSKIRSEVLQELGHNFWKRSAVVYGVALNQLNRAITQFEYGEPRNMWDNPKNQISNIMIGKDPVTGEEIYARPGKQLKDPMELLFSGGESTVRKTLSKVSPLINVGSLALTGQTLGGYETELSRMIERQERGTFARRLIEPVKALLPYSLQGAVSDKQLNALGFLVPLSKGATAGGTQKYYMNIITDAVKRGTKEIKFKKRTSREVEKDMFTQKEKLAILAIAQSAVNNGLDPVYVWKNAISRVKSDLTIKKREEAKQVLRFIHNNPSEYKRAYVKKLPKSVQAQIAKVNQERVANKKNAPKATRSIERIKAKYSKPTTLKFLPFGSN